MGMATTTAVGQLNERSSALSATDIGLFVLRLALGVIFIAHGGQKLFGLFGGPGLAATVDTFDKFLGIPVPLAYLAVFTEFFGGVALVVGLLSRLAGLGLAVTMVVATFKAHLANGFFLTSGQPPYSTIGYEYNLALFAMALAVVFTGPGRLALSDIERRWFHRI
jgi:putative oxidoreductase